VVPLTLDRCLELAQIAAPLGQGAVVSKLIEFLLNDVRPWTRQIVKSYEVIGQLAALRIASIVGAAGSALDRIPRCEELAAAEMGRLAEYRPGEHFPAFVTIECALAEAFAGPVTAANQTTSRIGANAP
jgi:hypothetical protein